MPLALTWRAPATCPTADVLRLELGQMARQREGFVLQPVEAHVEVALAAGVYRADLRTTHDGRQGVRQLAARDCSALSKSVALVLALTFGEGVELTPGASASPDLPAAPAAQPAQVGPDTPRESERERPAPAAAEPSSESSRAEPRASSAASRALAPLALRYALGAGVQLGLIGSAAAQVSALFELELAPLSLGLRASGSFAPSQSNTADIDSRFSAGSVALQACGALPLGPLSAALCGAGQLGVLHGSSSGAAHGASNAPWYAVSGRVALTWPRTFWLRLRAEAGLAVSLNRARFVIDGLGEVERVARVVPELALLMVFAP